MKFETILPFLCLSLDPLTNKHCRTWSSIVKLWIILLSERQRPSNYVESSKENFLGEYDVVTLTMLYVKVLHDMVSQNS